MAEKYKSKAELQAENDVLRTGRNINSWAKTIQTFFRYAALVVVAICVRDVGVEWAGETTSADINIFADVKAQGAINTDEVEAQCPETITKTEVAEYSWLMAVISVLLGFGGVMYGRSQDNLRKNVIEFYHPRIKKLEQALDEKRSSSSLTSRGNTRPEDK